jgi:DNA recombination protein RmuC
MITTILTGISALITGIILTHFIQKASLVSRRELDEAKEEIGALNNQLSTCNALIDERTENLHKTENENTVLKEDIRKNESQIAEYSAKLENKTESENELKYKSEKNDSRIEGLNEEIKELNSLNSKFEAENKAIQNNLTDQKKVISELQEKSILQFESIANKIFEEKTSSFSKSSKENIAQILSPLENNIKEFKQKVEDTYDKESKQRFSLEEKIKELVNLNEQISIDANNLTNALKGEAKTQGNWGEMILENILDHSGLVEDREYFVQESYTDDNGKRKQPDVVIRYPKDRHIVVDSKVSLTAYERFANCKDKKQQAQYLVDHIKSIRSHIDDLSSKEYDNIEQSLDFVFMFVPIEPAYMTAIHYDQDIWNYAYKKNIVLISPTNLIVALKMIADIWKREHQNANAMDIAKRGEALYDKFVNFVSDIDEMDKAINKASEKCTGAIKKLSRGPGNLVGQAEKLKKMGLNTKKSLPDKYLLENEELIKSE